MRGCRIGKRGALAFVSRANGHETLIDVRRQEKHHSSDDRDEKEMSHAIFDGVLERGETIDFCMCNPPFYPSREASIDKALKE